MTESDIHDRVERAFDLAVAKASRGISNLEIQHSKIQQDQELALAKAGKSRFSDLDDADLSPWCDPDNVIPCKIPEPLSVRLSLQSAAKKLAVLTRSRGGSSSNKSVRDSSAVEEIALQVVEPEPIIQNPFRRRETGFARSGANSKSKFLRKPLWRTSEPIRHEDLRDENLDLVPELPLDAESFQARMLEQGFCPHHAKHLSDKHSTAVLQQMAKIDKRLHRSADHTSCKEAEVCTAYNTHFISYEQQHTASCHRDGCYQVAVDHQHLIRIIATGDVPLVSIQVGPDGRLCLNLRRRMFRRSYATISHVWADGLGNPLANALPACQVDRLRVLLGSAAEFTLMQEFSQFLGLTPRYNVLKEYVAVKHSPLFWMDTLCIPPQAEHQPLRDKCIEAMSSIYAGSDRVFVLDKELAATKYRPYDALYRIACSTWMCRSWTLQEAKLPRQCLFEFADRVIDPLVEHQDRVADPFDPADMRDQLDVASQLIAPASQRYQYVTLLMQQARAGCRNLYSSALKVARMHRSEDTFQDEGATTDETRNSELQHEKALAEIRQDILFEFLGMRSLDEDPGMALLMRMIGFKKSHWMQITGTIKTHNIMRWKSASKRLSSDVTAVWNSLTGRSTTKEEDLYIVLATCMDLKLKSLQNVIADAERFHRILFSFQFLPFDLFFTDAPRRSLQNRWLPTGIGKNLLRKGSRICLPSSKISNHSEQAKLLELSLTNDVQFYITEHPIPASLAYIMYADGQALSLSLLEPFQMSLSHRFPSLMAIAVVRVGEDLKLSTKGCLFRVVSKETTGPDNGDSAVSSVGKYILDFVCPLRSSPLNNHERQMDLHCHFAFVAYKTTNDVKMMVTFEPIANFTPLKRQGIKRLPLWILYPLCSFPVLWILCTPIARTLAIAAVRAIHQLPHLPDIDGMHILLDGFVLQYLVALFTGLLAVTLFLFLSPILLPLFSVPMTLLDYLFLWHAFDDNTLGDQARSRIVIALKQIFTTLRCLSNLAVNMFSSRSQSVVLENDIEV